MGTRLWKCAKTQAINLEIEVDNIPISILLPEGWTIQEQSTDTVDIRFRGSQEDIRYLFPDTIKVILDRRNEEDVGEVEIQFEPGYVNASPLTRSESK